MNVPLTRAIGPDNGRGAIEPNRNGSLNSFSSSVGCRGSLHASLRNLSWEYQTPAVRPVRTGTQLLSTSAVVRQLSVAALDARHALSETTSTDRPSASTILSFTQTNGSIAQNGCLATIPRLATASTCRPGLSRSPTSAR